MGGRSLLKAPLDVLREQLVDLRVYLLDEEWADALRQAHLDPGALVSEVEDAIRQATGALVALRLAHQDVRVVTGRRAAWREAYAGWAAQVRAALKVAAPLSPEAAAAIRGRFGRYTGRSFGPSHRDLELVTAALRTYADPLGVHRWPADPYGAAEDLLAAAQQIVDEGVRAERVRAERSREAAAVADRIRDLIRRLRAAWNLARIADPAMPELPLAVLVAYTPGSRRPRKPRTEADAPEASEGAEEACTGAVAVCTGAEDAFTGAEEACNGAEAVSTGAEALSTGAEKACTGVEEGWA